MHYIDLLTTQSKYTQADVSFFKIHLTTTSKLLMFKSTNHGSSSKHNHFNGDLRGHVNDPEAVVSKSPDEKLSKLWEKYLLSTRCPTHSADKALKV